MSMVVARGSQITEAMFRHLGWKSLPEKFKLNPEQLYVIRVTDGQMSGLTPTGAPSPTLAVAYSSNPASPSKVLTTEQLARWLSVVYPYSHASFTDRPTGI